ncbi:MAG: ATP-binding cassette domain-containing protein [Alphaproteobacteria bacterium]|jgi:ATP-binding cassette subfamily C protein|nr:ATP-binding cassette domain-containing protein [Alphaproteobacteria bacterium]
MVHTPQARLRRGVRRSRLLLAFLAFMSFLVAMLMLTGPLYMLQLYDRVLVSGSVDTLVLLTILAGAAFVTYGVLEATRMQSARRFGLWLENDLADPALQAAARSPEPARPHEDLGRVRDGFQTPALFGFLDLPFSLLFLAAMAILHPWLGIYGTAAMALLIIVTLFNAWRTARGQQATTKPRQQLAQRAQSFLQGKRMLRAMGLETGLLARLSRDRRAATGLFADTLDETARLTGLARFLRYALQSGVLGLGAYLVLQGELGPGAMIAGSILLGRCLAPADQAISGMHVLIEARRSWRRVRELLERGEDEVPRNRLPEPEVDLVAKKASVLLGPNQVILRDAAARFQGGELVAVIGPSGAGKTTLLDVLAGVRRPQVGEVTLGGASLDLYPTEQIGQLVGYLPQHLALFPGTIAENIARLALDPDRDAVFRAADAAGATAMIKQLKDGFETVLEADGMPLSGGQRQQVALARAVYGEPPLLILDEPYAHLDGAGTRALEGLLKQRRENGLLTVMAVHDLRLAQLASRILVLRGGQISADGPADEIINRLRQPTRLAATA